MSFLGEIKRRKVFQVAAVYAVMAWLIIQVVGAIKNPLNLPDWLDTVVIVLLGVGFPVAVILAWAFDVTPEGIRATNKTDSSHWPSGPGHTKFTYASQILILVAVAFLILDQYIFEDMRSFSSAESIAVGAQNWADLRLDVVTPPTNSPASFALSPDGRQLAFVANSETGAQIWLRPLDREGSRPLEDTEGAAFPFWAPDGEAIAFFSDGQLKRIDITGGRAVFIANAPSARGGAWGADDVILFAPEPTSALLRVDANGGSAPVPVSGFVNGQGSHRWPHFLPDGRRFLYQVTTATGQSDGIYLGAVDGGEPVRVADADSHAEVVEPGYLLLIFRDALLAYPFDIEQGAVTGEPMTIARPAGFQVNLLGAFSVSRNGLLAYRALGESPRELAWFDRMGTRIGILGDADGSAPTDAALSPDGKRIAVSRYVQGNEDIWLFEAARGFYRATDDPAIDMGPVWSPDGEQIAYMSNRNESFDLFVRPSTNSGNDRALLVTSSNLYPQDWSPDGQYLLYAEESDNATAEANLWALPLDAEGEPPLPVAQSEFDETQGQFSPDGRWVAYASNRTGAYEIWVQPFPNPARLRQQISTAGGTYPVWERDGRELFFLSPDNTLMAVPLQITSASDAFDYGAPMPLFATEVVRAGTNIYPTGAYSTAQYAVALDGKLLMDVGASAGVPPINVVLNFTARSGL